MRRNGTPTGPQQGLGAVGHAEARKPPKRAKPPSEKRADDKQASAWFDAGVAAYGKADAYADEIAVDKSELSKMRSGDTVALRRLLPMQKHAPSALAFCESFLADVEVSEHPDAVLALVAPLLESIGMVARSIDAPTEEEVIRLSHEEAWEAGLLFREHLYRVAREKRGWTRQQVDIALRRKSK